MKHIPFKPDAFQEELLKMLQPILSDNDMLHIGVCSASFIFKGLIVNKILVHIQFAKRTSFYTFSSYPFMICLVFCFFFPVNARSLLFALSTSFLKHVPIILLWSLIGTCETQNSAFPDFFSFFERQFTLLLF